MAEDVKLEVIKKTQDLLGKYFKKPPLTEKLLKKPPFRFLHDIISAVINETGFLDGLFSEEELNSENIKNKEAKLAYLTKLIEVVKLATGINLTVRASKIISGQEATKTNELLQAIGKALDKKISSKEAIEHYKKNAKGKSISKSKSSTAKEEKSSSKERAQKKISTEKEKSTEQKKKISNTSNTIINETETSKKSSGIRETPQVEVSQEKVPSSAHKKKSSSAKHKQNITSVSLSETVISQTNTDKNVNENKKLEESENKSKQIIRDENNIPQNYVLSKVNTEHSESKFINSTENSKIDKNTKPLEHHTQNEMKNNETAYQNREKFDYGKSEDQKPQLESIDASISQASSRPKSSLRPPSTRPISARPAAPRIRGKAELTINEEMIPTPMGSISVIVENADTKEDDDAEDMVVMETKGSGDSLESNIYKANNQLTQERGHLVAQILETQKELVNNENVDVIPKNINITWDRSSKRDIAIKEIDKLRNTIQSLTRATNPLGKLLDYYQEDVEIMQKELLEWRTQYQQVNEQLKIEKTKTQEVIEPMRETLKEIDHNMRIQLDKICQTKLQIMKNDQRIQTLLNGHI